MKKVTLHSVHHETIRDCFTYKAVQFSAIGGTLGFRIGWYLWSADIWFGNFPLLKFLVGCNVLVWLILFWGKV